MLRHQTNHNFLSKLLTFYCFEVVLINLMSYVKVQGYDEGSESRDILIIILHIKDMITMIQFA